MKITIEQVNGVWQYTVEYDHSTIAAGERDTFSGCCAKCLEIVNKSRWQDSEDDE